LDFALKLRELVALIGKNPGEAQALALMSTLGKLVGEFEDPVLGLNLADDNPLMNHLESIKSTFDKLQAAEESYYSSRSSESE
jgi:hypothetical protein